MRVQFALVSFVLLSACSAAEEDSGPDRSPSNGYGGSSGSGGAGGSTASGGSVASAGQASGGTATAGTGTAGSGTAGSSTAGNSTAGSAGTGTAGTGSGGSSAAALCSTTMVGSGTPALIDDLEDNNADIAIQDNRAGGWYLSTDMTSTTTPPEGVPTLVADGNPGNSIHVTGSNFTDWGVSLSAAVVAANGCYDATPYTGVKVSLKGSGKIWVSVLTAAVRAAPVGQRNHYKKQVTLGAGWTEVTVKFSELTQPNNWGVMVAFDKTKIYGIDFAPDSATTPISFDFSVDNLAFTTD